MKILLWPSSFAPNIGGVERVTATVARLLQAGGHEAVVLTTRWPKPLPRDEVIGGIHVSRLDFPLPARNVGSTVRFAASVLPALLRLNRMVSSFAPDVIHVHCVSGQAMYRMLAPAVRGCPMVVTLHGEQHGDAEAVFQRSPLLRWLLRRTLAQAAAITACSTPVLDAAVALLTESPTLATVVPNGIEIPAILAARQPETLISCDVFAAGRLNDVKGFDQLIRAIAKLRTDGVEVSAVIAGDGPERGRLEALVARLGLGESVEFLGWIDQDDIGPRIRAARVVVVPSRYEAFSLVAAEAMANAIPVAAFDVGGVSEVVGGAGLTVPAGNVAALAAAIGRIIGDNQFAEGLGRAGRQRARSRFDWEQVVDDYLDIYQSVLQSKQRRDDREHA